MLFFTAMEGIQECSLEPIEMPTATSLSSVNFHLHISLPSTNVHQMLKCLDKLEINIENKRSFSNI